MRVVTWNMGCGPRSRYRHSHGEAWEYLRNELEPDVALVQEALVTEVTRAQAAYAVTLCDRANDTVEAGTAVLVRHWKVAPAASLLLSDQTYAVPVKVTTPAGRLIVVAAHVYPKENLHRDLAKLTELASTTYGDLPVLLGGDFNSARRFDEVYGGKKHRGFFAAMEAGGLHDVHFGIHGRETQSFWGHQTKEQYQDDHFFLSKTWIPRATSCEVVDNEFVRRLSDHGPVVLELDVDAGETSSRHRPPPRS